MSGINIGCAGVAGEVRFVLKAACGTIKQDTGYQKNLILNQGLDFFGGGHGDSMFERCAIGAGNSAPTITQTNLDSFVAMVTGVQSNSSINYVPDASNLYKSSSTYKYTFTGLNNANLAEVGLVSDGTSPSNYYLCTRALVKDTQGAPSIITVLQGEVLEVYYKLWRVVSTEPVTTVVNMLDGAGGAVPYNVLIKPVSVGDASMWQTVGRAIKVDNNYSILVTSEEPTPVDSAPDYKQIALENFDNQTYVPNSYKRRFYINAGISEANIGIRTIWTGISSTVPFQVRFGSVANDSPIPKSSQYSLSMPFEFSWGRYEGVL